METRCPRCKKRTNITIHSDTLNKTLIFKCDVCGDEHTDVLLENNVYWVKELNNLYNKQCNFDKIKRVIKEMKKEGTGT